MGCESLPCFDPTLHTAVLTLRCSHCDCYISLLLYVKTREVFKYLLSLETPEANVHLYKQLGFFFPIVSNNSLIIILKLLFCLRCVTFPPIWQQSAQDVGCTAPWFFLLWVVAAPSNIFPLNKVGVGVPGVCSTKGRIFSLLFLHVFAGWPSAFCYHYHNCGTGGSALAPLQM